VDHPSELTVLQNVKQVQHTATCSSCRDPGTAVIHLWLPGGVRRRPQRVTTAVNGADVTRNSRRRCYYGRAPPLLRLLPPPVLLRLLLVLLYSQFGD